MPQGVTYGSNDALAVRVAHLVGQGFEILVASNHLENLFDGDFAEGDKRGRSHQSALFVFDRSDRWHEIGHSVVVWHHFLFVSS